MRLIECKIWFWKDSCTSKKSWVNSCIDLDKIDAVIGEQMEGVEGTHSFLLSGDHRLIVDIPYEKAVELWENYRINKGVSTTLD